MHTPTSHPLSPQKLPHSGVLGGITSKILELLDSEAFLHQSQELERLFLQLIDALNTKVNKAGYDYKDYEQRLLRGEEDLEAILAQDQTLSVLYEKLLKATEFAPYLKQALWDKLLFDRVLELGPPSQEFPEFVTVSELKSGVSIPHYPKIIDLPNIVSAKELGEVFLKIKNAPGVLAIDLSRNDLFKLDEPSLQSIFSHLGDMRSIDLTRNDLYNLDEPSLHAIFSHLSGVRSIDLSRNVLGKLDLASLQTIFSHLRNVISIDLGDNKIGELDEPRLQAIFSYLGNAKNIDLRYNDLGYLDELRLQAIFSHLGDVRSIDVRGNDLWNLDEPSLQAIFSHLGDVRSIDVRGNDLWNLDEPSLQAIFFHLIHIEEVILDSQEEGSVLESLFPNLIGKIKIV